MSSEKMSSAPKVDPEDLALRARPRPVKQVNRRLLFLLSGTSLVLLASAVFMALDPPQIFDRMKTGNELYRTENHPKPDGLEQLPKSYGELAPKIELGPPLPGILGPGSCGPSGISALHRRWLCHSVPTRRLMLRAPREFDWRGWHSREGSPVSFSNSTRGFLALKGFSAAGALQSANWYRLAPTGRSRLLLRSSKPGFQLAHSKRKQIRIRTASVASRRF